MVPVPKGPADSGSVDPLSGLSGLSLFPRTIRASADAPKDLESIHNIMKSLKELRSPEKLMTEAKKIVDGGANFLSNFSSLPENVSVTNDIAAKVKNKPLERRPALGLARKKASFSLKTNVSHPPVNLEQTIDIDHLQDPDAFFDAYERNENANKEIQKQLGGCTENIHHYKPSNNIRRHRQGILGKSYNHKHRHSSTASENDDMWMSSQDTLHEDIPSPPKDESHEKLVDPDPNLDDDLEESELVESMKKTESQVNDMLEELLSCHDEDLDGQGALNLLQDKLKIKTLDLENLFCLTELPDVGRTNVTSSGSRKKPCKSSFVFDSVLKNLNKKPPVEQELVENPVNLESSPTPPRFPSGSVSLLKKKVFLHNPLTDPFSSEGINNCERPNSSPARTKVKLPGQVAEMKDLGTSNELESPNNEFAISDMDSQEVIGTADTLPQQSRGENASMQRESGSSMENATPKDLGMCNEFESPTDGNDEFAVTDMDSQKVMGNADTLPQRSRGENASMHKESGSSRANASPAQPKDKLVRQVDAQKDVAMSSETDTHVEFDSTKSPLCKLDTVIENADHLPEQFEDENASIPNMSASHKQNEESGKTNGKAMNTNKNELNSSIVEKEVTDDTSTRQEIGPEQQPEVPADKRQRGKGVAGAKRIRDAHPIRKSLADAGTSFETGLRRSKRVKMRPLEYWKGERFLYGRVDNSLKLIGLKYISPGKSNENLKVKPYIPSNKPEYKQLLELAARH